MTNPMTLEQVTCGYSTYITDTLDNSDWVDLNQWETIGNPTGTLDRDQAVWKLSGDPPRELGSGVLKVEVTLISGMCLSFGIVSALSTYVPYYYTPYLANATDVQSSGFSYVGETREYSGYPNTDQSFYSPGYFALQTRDYYYGDPGYGRDREIRLNKIYWVDGEGEVLLWDKDAQYDFTEGTLLVGAVRLG